MSKSILHINTSPLGDNSVTRKLTANILSQLAATLPGSSVVERDLAASPLPHISALTLSAFHTPPDQLNPAQSESLVLSDTLIDEVIAADVIVIAAPMWNFGIPSALKAWIDHIVRAGRTFQYGAAGPEGLLSADKKVIVASARGGVYSEGPLQAMDHQETYMQSVLGFIGLQDVAIVRAEGFAIGDEEALSTALQAADAQIADAVKQIA